MPVGGEGLSGSEESEGRPRPTHRHPARGPGQPEGGALLPEEEPRRGEILAEAKVTSRHDQGALPRLNNLLYKLSGTVLSAWKMSLRRFNFLKSP